MNFWVPRGVWIVGELVVGVGKTHAFDDAVLRMKTLQKPKGAKGWGLVLEELVPFSTKKGQ